MRNDTTHHTHLKIWLDTESFLFAHRSGTQSLVRRLTPRFACVTCSSCRCRHSWRLPTKTESRPEFPRTCLPLTPFKVCQFPKDNTNTKNTMTRMMMWGTFWKRKPRLPKLVSPPRPPPLQPPLRPPLRPPPLPHPPRTLQPPPHGPLCTSSKNVCLRKHFPRRGVCGCVTTQKQSLRKPHPISNALARSSSMKS